MWPSATERRWPRSTKRCKRRGARQASRFLRFESRGPTLCKSLTTIRVYRKTPRSPKRALHPASRESAADSRTGYAGLHRHSVSRLSRPSRCCRPLSALLVFRCGEWLVPDGLRHSDFAVWELSVIFDVVDDPVGGRNQVGDFLGLVRRQIEHLHASAGDFHSMVVPEAVPRLTINRRPCKLLGNNEFDLSHRGIWVSRVVDLAHDVRIGCDDFAIVMVGAHNEIG